MTTICCELKGNKHITRHNGDIMERSGMKREKDIYLPQQIV